MNLTDEQWRRGGQAARFNDSDYVFHGEEVERIVAEQVEAARAETDRWHDAALKAMAGEDAARAAERALVESLGKLADEWDRQGSLANVGGYGFHLAATDLRAALAARRPDTEGAEGAGT